MEALGYLDPETGEPRHVHLGAGAAPHGVIVGTDGAPWITDGGLNAIVRVDPLTDAVYVDTADMVWLSDFGANVMVRFDPESETFEVFELPSPGAQIRQILGRPGEVWGGESGTDKLMVIRTK